MQAIFTGNPQGLGTMRLLLIADDGYGGSAQTALAVEAIRTPFDEFIYVLKFVGPILTALGVSFRLYRSRGA